MFIFRSERREETEKPPLKPNGSAGVQQRLEKKQKTLKNTFKKTLKKTFLQPFRLLRGGLRGGRGGGRGGGSIPLPPSYVTGASVRITLCQFCFGEELIFRKRIIVT